MKIYNIKYSKNFKKQLRKVLKQGKSIDKLLEVVDKLSKKEKLNIKYCDHALANNNFFQNSRECHIEPDWLLIYKYNDNELILYLVSTGSHSDLFNM